MPKPENSLAEALETCSPERRAGFARCDNGETAPQAIGSHTLCDRAPLKCHPADLS
ncbi:hypothetical protein [Thiocapsa bogorovii]|uniref:hypothetical protein n=1 Tax=Thiocapsa bogorovii TaxID=521689 RepID=UPI001E4346F3|nr:hypothetical protein [Thiocapsa bogorovii]UHD17936.1 hypothetical protein LT988_07825 [Thiocapsa bogorovii]